MNERDLPPLSAGLRELIDSERQRPDCSSAERERLEHRIESSLDWLEAAPSQPQAAPPPVPEEPSSQRPATGSRLRWSKGIAAGILAAFGVGAAAHAAYVATVRRATAQQEPAPPRAQPPPPTPTVKVPAALPQPPAPAPAPVQRPAPTPEPARAPRREPGPAAGGSDQLAEERAMLDVARTALGMERYPEAQAALEGHQRQFARGKLAEERESLMVQLLVGRGALDEARVRAHLFHAQFPESVFWPAMQELLTRVPERRAP